MQRLRGHFDGHGVVLDQPAPPDLKPDAPVEVLILDAREAALRDFQRFLVDLWSRPIGKGPTPRQWTREELHDRGSSGH